MIFTLNSGKPAKELETLARQPEEVKSEADDNYV